MTRQVFENMIKAKFSELKFQANVTFSQGEFEKEKDSFLKRLKKNVESYFFVTHEKFEIRVFQIFKKEFVDYVDFFLNNKENLTRIKLIKRNHEIFLREVANNGEASLGNVELFDELQSDLKDLEYIDNPQSLWNDLDTKIKNMFIERYIGGSFPNCQSRDKPFRLCSVIANPPFTKSWLSSPN